MKLRILRWGDGPGSACGPHVVTRAFTEGGPEGWTSRRQDEGRSPSGRDASLKMEGTPSHGMTPASGSWEGTGSDCPPELPEGSPPCRHLGLSPEPSLGPLTWERRPAGCCAAHGASSFVAAVRRCADGALDECHGHPAPHTCFPARSVLPHLTLAGSCMAHLLQEAFRAHLAESPSSP